MSLHLGKSNILVSKQEKYMLKNAYTKLPVVAVSILMYSALFADASTSTFLDESDSYYLLFAYFLTVLLISLIGFFNNFFSIEYTKHD